MKTILLTGATGFLGSRILPILLKKKHYVVILKRSQSDISRISSLLSQCAIYNVDEISLNRLFDEQEIDTIIHTAASYGRQNETLREIINANFKFPLELLNSAIEKNVRCFINAGTSLPPSINPYSLAKKQFKEWLVYSSNKISVKHVMMEYFYGPGDSDWKLVTMILKKLSDQAAAIEFTSGEQRRDFIYIDDVVNAFECLLNDTEGKGFEEYPLGSGFGVSIKELAIKCKQLTGNKVTELLFGALPSRQEEAGYVKCNTTNLEKKGWSCAVTLDEGLSLTYQELKR